MGTTRLGGPMVAVMAVGCGAAVANNYYGQPLLDVIADSFGVAPGTAAFIVTAGQVGYAVGLALIVPLGDLVERRGLVVWLMVATAGALMVTAAAPSLAVLAGALVVVGTATVSAQVLVPLAATLADEESRGRVVGTIMSGLLIGVLVARTVSGVIAQVGGWRLVYALAAVVMLVLAVVLRRVLPRSLPPVGDDLTYGAVLRSIGQLLAHGRVLRRRMVYGATGMAGFTMLWTSLTFLLSDPPYRFNEATIGLFGLFGVAGAASAQIAGRLADRGWSHRATGGSLVVVALGWALLALGTRSLVAVVAGLVLFDLGIQGQHILNQSAIYQAYPDARSRVTTAYMTGNFLCGALGSAGAAVAYGAGGWGAVVGLGLAIASVALVAWLHEHVTRRRHSAPATAGG